MRKDTATPFDTIESAHDFVTLLAGSVPAAKAEVASDLDRTAGAESNRRRDALLVAAYNLERLEYHLARSARLLNDLRSLRRLLLEERAKPVFAVKPKPHTTATPKNGKPVAVA